MRVDSVSGVSPRELRNAFGCFATGVALATCQDKAGRPVAVTINSFCSVSLAPPLISFALGNSARCLQPFLLAQRFAVQILSSSQLQLSSRFARPTNASWDGVGYRRSEAGDVLLDEVAAVFVCDLTESRAVGDHVVFLGEVRHFAYAPERESLAFCRGRYAKLDPIGPEHPLHDFFDLPGFGPQLGWG